MRKKRGRKLQRLALLELIGGELFDLLLRTLSWVNHVDAAIAGAWVANKTEKDDV